MHQLTGRERRDDADHAVEDCGFAVAERKDIGVAEADHLPAGVIGDRNRLLNHSASSREHADGAGNFRRKRTLRRPRIVLESGDGRAMTAIMLEIRVP